MSVQPDVLWISTSPSLQRFDRFLIRHLSHQVTIAQWEYYQNPDEPSSLDIALVLLHDYLKSCRRPIHLIGHSTSGLLGLLYTRQHPERVKSLTLLAVGVNPVINWQAHYYVMYQLLPCSRNMILAKMVQNLFGFQHKDSTQDLVRLLEQDLNFSPSPHSLYQQATISPGSVPVPLMVCGSQDDLIVDPMALQGWKAWMKEGDRIWECPGGHHFFHYYHPQLVARQILKFWHQAVCNEIDTIENILHRS
jgi:pimeloyl-ACP methyl ester carboxylesterase